MSLKENLKLKIKLDRLLLKLVSTIREPPGQRWLDKPLTRELLGMTDFEAVKVRDLHLYVRPCEGTNTEVVVLDNELAVYHTTVDDVALRKSPVWQEIFSIRNIKKIMNDQDVITSKGKASLKKIHADAVALLDLTYGRDDLTQLLDDAREALAQKSIEQLEEVLELFTHLLDFKPVSLGVPVNDLQFFARHVYKAGEAPVFEHLILFNEKTPALGMRRGIFSPQNDLDLNWVLKYARGKESPDLKDIQVFEFLSELALEKARI